MQTRSPIHPLRLGISALTLAAAFALVFYRHDIKAFLRMFGFWSYLASVNSELPDAKLVNEARRVCQDVDALVPYWGARRWPHGGPSPAVEVRREQPTEANSA